MYKIAVVYSTYPEIEKIAHEYTSKKGYHVTISNCVLDKAIDVAKEFESDGYDIIISRGATGGLISKMVNIPVVNIDITNFDIIKTLQEAKEKGRKIGLFLYDNKIRQNDFSFIRKVLNIKKENLKVYYFNSVLEINEKISKAYQDGTEVIVGIGAYTSEIAQKYGLKTAMVRSQSEAIYNAFEQARYTIEAVQKLRKMNEYFTALVEDEYLGLIFLDEDYSIKFINDSICRFLKINHDLLLNRKVNEAFKEVSIFKPLLNNENNYNIKYNESDLVVKKTILHSFGKIIGYVIKIQYAKYDSNVLTFHNRSKIVGKNTSTDHKARYTLNDYIGQSDVVQNLLKKAKSYSKSDANILLIGESGTGKEILANGIHNASPRYNKSFVAVNCAALPQSLLESELFGYEDGAFTGAKRGGKVGIFEIAQGGTVFLDEISEITLAAQAQLLRVIQERLILRVGGNRPIPVDVRIVAATNANLPERMRQGQFREDLYHRLNVLNLPIPPLRKRKEDIPVLLEHFINKYTINNKTIEIPDILMNKFQNYRWSGNVRELENFVEKFVILLSDTREPFKLLENLYFDLVNSEISMPNNQNDRINISIGTLKDMEMEIIDALSSRYPYDRTTLAKKLGISRTSLWSKLKEIENLNNY